MLLSGLSLRATQSGLLTGAPRNLMPITVIGESLPSVPESFQKRLQQFDPDLYVTWHVFRGKPGRWKIERCTHHYGSFDLSGRPIHSHVCARVYILMCQDDEGTPLPLGEHVFEKLRQMRARWESLGGDTDRGVRNAIAESDRIETDLETKRQAAAEDVMAYNRKDKRLQINKAFDLIQRHDLRPNK